MKNRHLKTPEGKYGNYSLMKTVIEFLKESKKHDNKYRFDHLPYLGICYLPEIPDFYVKGTFEKDNCDIQNENGGLIKCKVISVDNNYMTLVYFSDHLYQIVFLEIYNSDIILEGNIIKRRKYKCH